MTDQPFVSSTATEQTAGTAPAPTPIPVPVPGTTDNNAPPSPQPPPNKPKRKKHAHHTLPSSTEQPAITPPVAQVPVSNAPNRRSMIEFNVAAWEGNQWEALEADDDSHSFPARRMSVSASRTPLLHD